MPHTQHPTRPQTAALLYAQAQSEPCHLCQMSLPPSTTSADLQVPMVSLNTLMTLQGIWWLCASGEHRACAWSNILAPPTMGRAHKSALSLDRNCKQAKVTEEALGPDQLSVWDRTGAVQGEDLTAQHWVS